MSPRKTVQSKRAIDYIQEAMERIESLACGGIGEDGMSLESLRALENDGDVANQDSMYHDGQVVWRLLELALRDLTE